ncbi:uncharacterized protein LOC116779151 [Danaus plexippus]|uniref:uncharacterized protein LOC116779151 n=1 Tax=Danaus plexippus TaxID=13037 RepID=UPI002AAF3054|nr:uncharacterized protein LOC116779151 [Danaus plexippus]
MYTPIAFLIFGVLGGVVAYNVHRELPYNTGPYYDPYTVEVNSNFGLEPSQRLFWGSQGGNQVGGNGGLWSKITNKFPFLENIFGRMQLAPEYGVPGVQQHYGPPAQFQPKYYHGQYQQQFLPAFGRDVAFTDDAVIITPPEVPIVPQPIPQPEPQPGYHYSKPQNRLELPPK